MPKGDESEFFSTFGVWSDDKKGVYMGEDSFNDFRENFNAFGDNSNAKNITFCSILDYFYFYFDDFRNKSSQNFQQFQRGFYVRRKLGLGKF